MTEKWTNVKMLVFCVFFCTAFNRSEKWQFYIILAMPVVWLRIRRPLCLVLFSINLHPCACVCATVCIACMSGFQSNVKEAAVVWMGRASEDCACLLIYVCVHMGKWESSLWICACVCLCVSVCLSVSVGFHACVRMSSCFVSVCIDLHACLYVIVCSCVCACTCTCGF